MTSGIRRPLIFAAAALVMGWAAAAPAAAQSAAQVSKARQKVKQAQSQEAARTGGHASGEAPSTQPRQAAPAGTPPAGETGALTVVETDPNHLSAVEALEQIRRDEEAAAAGKGFTYDPRGRRDPFLSPQDILQAQMSGQICQGEGMECWLIQDVTVIGVLTRRGGAVALVIGPDGYGTTLHEGDRLYDGEVRRIDPRSGLVVFRQKINDPTRIKPFRDVEKGLNLNKEGRS